MPVPRLIKPCIEFSPSTKTASICFFCTKHWQEHSNLAKTAFMANTTPEERSRLIETCKAENAACEGYYPAKEYIRGEGVPDCTCGKSARQFHKPGEIMKGINRWREATGKPVCGKFWSSHKTPGKCEICHYKWIDHSDIARGRMIEDLEHIHQLWCKCVQLPGAECTCMTDEAAQVRLDQMGERVACKKFKSKSVGNTTCGDCGEPFYQHSSASRNGHIEWLDWQQHNMTQQQVLTWFMLLGQTRKHRLDVVRRILVDPSFRHPTQNDKTSPDLYTIGSIYEALTHEEVEPIAKAGPAMTVNEVLSKVATDDEIANDKAFICYSCGEFRAKVEGAVCAGCAKDYVDQGSTKTADQLTGGED